jgi:hypothetical protein
MYIYISCVLYQTSISAYFTPCNDLNCNNIEAIIITFTLLYFFFLNVYISMFETRLFIRVTEMLEIFMVPPGCIIWYYNIYALWFAICACVVRLVDLSGSKELRKIRAYFLSKSGANQETSSSLAQCMHGSCLRYFQMSGSEMSW